MACVLCLFSCQKPEDKAIKTVEEFWSLAQKGLAKANNIYPNYSLPPNIDRPAVAELTKIGDLKVVESKIESKGIKTDTCVVICENLCYDYSGELKNFRVKFYIEISPNKSTIYSSIGLIQLRPTMRSLLEKTGAINDLSEDTYIAYSYNDFMIFVNEMIKKYGEAIETMNFNGNEYRIFLDKMVNDYNSHLFDRFYK